MTFSKEPIQTPKVQTLPKYIELSPVVVTAIHRRDNTMATVLTAIVCVFIVCHTPKAALNLYEVGTVGSNFNSLLQRRTGQLEALCFGSILCLS